MRLNKATAKVATAELLEMLKQTPAGMTTTELIGTPKFHGSRTLTPRQITRLLRVCEQVTGEPVGSGYMTPILWQVKQ